MRWRGSRSGGVGELRHTGYIPLFAEELLDKGLLDVEVFQ